MTSHTPPHATHISVHLCVPEDQTSHIPRRRRAPHVLPLDAPLPREGEVIYLSSSSAWAVQMVIHNWRAVDTLVIEVWITHIGSKLEARPVGFELTQ